MWFVSSEARAERVQQKIIIVIILWDIEIHVWGFSVNVNFWIWFSLEICSTTVFDL